MTYEEVFAARQAERIRLKKKLKQDKPRRHSLVRQSLRERLMNDWVERRFLEMSSLKNICEVNHGSFD